MAIAVATLGAVLGESLTDRTAPQRNFTDATNVSQRDCAISTPTNATIARKRLDVRDAVIGTSIACRVSRNQRHRSCPWSVAGNRAWHGVARTGKLAHWHSDQRPRPRT